MVLLFHSKLSWKLGSASIATQHSPQN